MAKAWHYAKGSENHGPVTSDELKQLAASGQLRPDDLVWSDGMTDWRPAKSVSGLFNNIPPATNGPSPVYAVPNAAAVAWSERLSVLVLLLVFCFPAGLLLMWLHPRWTTNQKWFGTGGVLGIFILLGIIGQFDPPQNPTTTGDSPGPSQAAASQEQAGRNRTPETSGVTAEAASTTTANADVDTLTAEFLPAEAEWEWSFSDELYDEVTGREASKSVVRWRARNAKVIEVEEQAIRPIRSSTPTRYEISRRASGQFISWGRSNAVLPLVKIGARKGESWTAPDGSKITFVGFKDERNRVAQITIDEPSKSGGPFIRQTVTLERGSGVSYISHIVITNGQPARSAFRVFSRTSTANIP